MSTTVVNLETKNLVFFPSAHHQLDCVKFLSTVYLFACYHVFFASFIFANNHLNLGIGIN